MSLHSRVSWKDGMFLLPQHFQQAERSVEAAIDLRCGAAAALGWGVMALELREDEIEKGAVEVVRCQAVMPDGLPIDVREGGDAAPPARRIAAAPTAQSVDVFLTVPRRRVGVPLVAADATRADARYVERQVEVADEQAPERTQTIEVASKNVRLALGGDALAGLDALKIAELSRTPSGGYALRRDYIPPCPRISGAPALERLAGDLVAALLARAAELLAERRNRGVATEISPTEMYSFCFLQTLQAQVPVLRHLVELRAAHPAQLYQELVRLAGALALFSPEAYAIAELPAYDHTALNACFGRVAELLHRTVGRVFRSGYEKIPLAQKGRLRVGHIAPGELLAGGEFYLAVGGALSPEHWGKLPTAAMVAEAGQIDTYLAKAYPAVGLEPRARPPSPVHVRGDARYFRLDVAGERWQEVRRTGDIAVYVPSWMGGIEVELIGIYPEGAK